MERKKREKRTAYYGKPWLINHLAKRCRFTVGDVKIIVDELILILQEIAAEQKSICIPHLFAMKVIELPGHTGWDGYRNKPIELPTVKKVIFKPSRTMTEACRGNLEWVEVGKKIEDEFEEEE